MWAQALLKVRLDKVAEINMVLLTIDRNPEIVDQIVPALEAAASELEGTVGGPSTKSPAWGAQPLTSTVPLRR
ncbi:MAG TPA: hypothetical protein VFP81_00960 [Propionibacteriaceae bacterium]|nr:hypothetical protein [Propionibacteriaceae bacterium]